jgi:hypothetical protein
MASIKYNCVLIDSILVSIVGSYLHGHGEHSCGLIVIAPEDAGDGLVFPLWNDEFVDIQVNKPLSTITVPARHG